MTNIHACCQIAAVKLVAICTRALGLVIDQSADQTTRCIKNGERYRRVAIQVVGYVGGGVEWVGRYFNSTVKRLSLNTCPMTNLYWQLK